MISSLSLFSVWTSVFVFKKPAVNGLGQISLLGEPDQPRPPLGLNLVPAQAKPVLASPVQTFPPAQLTVCSVSHPEIHQIFKKIEKLFCTQIYGKRGFSV